MQYIILLRGINVGGRNLKMDELKSCFEKNGYSNVQTILQTGNIIVTSKEKSTESLTKKAETMLEKNFHYPAKVITIAPDHLKKITEANPFLVADPNFHRYIVFLKNGFEKTITKDFRPAKEVEEKINVGDGVIYWTVPKGSTLDSPFGKYLAKISTKEFQTTRNVNTLEKILAKCE